MRRAGRLTVLKVCMKIVFISDWFSEKMGYAENCLPKAVAALGHEVHLIAGNVQPYFDKPYYDKTYGPFLGPGVVATGTQDLDGYTLHRLPHAWVMRRLRIQGLMGLLRELRPHVVQTFESMSWSTYEAALVRPLVGYVLFLESHMHASLFGPIIRPKGRGQRMKWRLYAATLGRWVSASCVKCYPITGDAAKVAEQFLGVEQRKIEVCSLGVDTALFHPALGDALVRERVELRQKLGFAPSDIVCIYTGRISSDKGTLLLARAVGALADEGQPFHALFVGDGTAEEIAAICAIPGCVVHPFVNVKELPPFYRAADIAVWPRLESTSQLDAAACGLPLILGSAVEVRERIEGNGLLYQQDSVEDLARQMAWLADPERRRQLGAQGAQKMRERFSWDRIARQRVQDYANALAGRRDGIGRLILG